MRRNIPTLEEALALVSRVDEKYRPAWEGRSPHEQAALASYFLPHGSSKPALAPTRPRVIKWYCPFASQRDFPTGHRYCINVYTGCAHQCIYCYAAAYEPDHVSTKQGFHWMLDRDLLDLERLDVPPAPVHLSNSTDPFQPLEERTGHTRYALGQILEHRHRFTSVIVLTKNPALPVDHGYLDVLRALAELPADHPRATEFRERGLPGLVVEVSLAFWRDEARAFYDPCAPSVQSRLEAIRSLRAAGIPVVIRTDPLFPSPGSRQLADASCAGDSSQLPPAQTVDDLNQLVSFAAEVDARHVVYSVAKICKPRGQKQPDPMQAMKCLYQTMAAPHKLDFAGGSWRLPWPIAQSQVVDPFLQACAAHGVQAKYCKQNLLDTP